MKWISIEDELPVRDELVLIHALSADPDCPLITVAMLMSHNDKWFLSLQPFEKSITHWMKLPEPPENE